MHIITDNMFLLGHCQSAFFLQSYMIYTASRKLNYLLICLSSTMLLKLKTRIIASMSNGFYMGQQGFTSNHTSYGQNPHQQYGNIFSQVKQ